MKYATVLSFWFEKTKPSQWWSKDPEFDHEIRQRFLQLHGQATCCELFEWRETARGRLAEIIVLDQFSRNIFRDSPQAFAADNQALALAQEAVAQGTLAVLAQPERNFLLLPYMHSESLKIHDSAVELYKKHTDKAALSFEIKHREIIERFGRYPHRNATLGRQSTQEELTFLKQPGSHF